MCEESRANCLLQHNTDTLLQSNVPSVLFCSLFHSNIRTTLNPHSPKGSLLLQSWILTTYILKVCQNVQYQCTETEVCWVVTGLWNTSFTWLGFVFLQNLSRCSPPFPELDEAMNVDVSLVNHLRSLYMSHKLLPTLFSFKISFFSVFFPWHFNVKWKCHSPLFYILRN